MASSQATVYPTIQLLATWLAAAQIFGVMCAENLLLDLATIAPDTRFFNYITNWLTNLRGESSSVQRGQAPGWHRRGHGCRQVGFACKKRRAHDSPHELGKLETPEGAVCSEVVICNIHADLTL